MIQSKQFTLQENNCSPATEFAAKKYSTREGHTVSTEFLLDDHDMDVPCYVVFFSGNTHYEILPTKDLIFK